MNTRYYKRPEKDGSFTIGAYHEGAEVNPAHEITEAEYTTLLTQLSATRDINAEFDDLKGQLKAKGVID